MTKRTCTVAGCDRTHRCKGYCGPHYTRFRKYGTPGPAAVIQRALGTPEERFWPKVNKTDSCWLWEGALLKSGGYGHFNLCHGRGQVRAHMFAYEALVGPIPDGMVLDHVCHVPACVNPDHLRPVTRRQNIENHNGRSRRDNRWSEHRGVTFDVRRNRWVAKVRLETVGYFATEAEAAEAARRRRCELFTHNDLDRLAEAP